MKKLILIFLSMLFSCNSEYTAPEFYFKGDFDYKNVNSLEKYIKKIAQSKGFKIYEKDRVQMKFLTQGHDAFFIAFYVDGYDRLPIFSISNVGSGSVLVVSINSHGTFSRKDAKKLAIEIIGLLKIKFDTEMINVNPIPQKRLNTKGV